MKNPFENLATPIKKATSRIALTGVLIAGAGCAGCEERIERIDSADSATYTHQDAGKTGDAPKETDIDSKPEEDAGPDAQVDSGLTDSTPIDTNQSEAKSDSEPEKDAGPDIQVGDSGSDEVTADVASEAAPDAQIDSGSADSTSMDVNQQETGLADSEVENVPPDVEAVFQLQGFQETKQLLQSMEYPNPITNQQETGLHIVLNILANGYAQNGQVNLLKQTLDDRLKNIPIPQRILIMRVVQSLWAERTGVVPWKLKDYTPEQLRLLYFVPEIQGQVLPAWIDNLGSSVQLTNFLSDKYGDSNLEYEASFELYPLASKLKAPTREETINQAIKWTKANLFHSYIDDSQTPWTWDRYADGRPDSAKWGGSVFLPASLERLFEERISGCHEPALVIASIMRSLNIPPLVLNVKGHGAVYLYDQDKFIHGDHLVIYNWVSVEDQIHNIAWITEADSDQTLDTHLSNELLTKYGSDYLVMHGPPEIGRKDTAPGMSLYFTYLWDMDSTMSHWPAEFPQFTFESNPQTGKLHATVNTSPIKHLQYFSDSGSDIWHPQWP